MKDPTTYVCGECKGDRKCPVCDLVVDGERGMSSHFRHRREAGDEAHFNFRSAIRDAEWDGKVEGQDYVRASLVTLRQQEAIAYLPEDDGFVYSTEGVPGSAPPVSAPIMRVDCIQKN